MAVLFMSRATNPETSPPIISADIIGECSPAGPSHPKWPQAVSTTNNGSGAWGVDLGKTAMFVVG